MDLGNADDAGLPDRRVPRQRCLHLEGRDVFAPADDHALPPTHEPEIAVLVHDRHVDAVRRQADGPRLLATVSIPTEGYGRPR